ncbi:hypothetical protein DXB51_29030 [Bacillus cereus]|nr:hypothetical protein DXB51_29030 [Bacillus cereus]
MVVPNLPLEVINSYAKQLVCQSDTNLVSLVMMREQAGAVYPTEQELSAKQLVCQSDTNLVSLVMMREQAGAVYPTEQELSAIVKQVRAEKLEAYVDNVKQEPLIAQAPKAGKIRRLLRTRSWASRS